MKTILMTVGLPQSGKSTWARKQGLPIVNPDSIRLSLHGLPYIEKYESEVWRIARIMVESLFLAGNDIIILDATNLTKERQDRWKSHKWEIFFKRFHTPKTQCIRRAKKNNKEYLIPIIEKMDRERRL